jgi:endonuclease/exonuclease/phosphatase family metal-dependent hydrolase
VAIRVVSWNVLADAYVRREYYPHLADRPNVLDRAGRRRAVADRLLDFAKVDVLCLQEVDAALFALAEERLSESAGRLFKKRGKGEGCAIFVRHAITSDAQWTEHVFSDRSSHIALGVTFAGVSVVTTHLKWEPEGTDAAAHRGRIQLAELLDTWSKGSRIVCGDFNAGPESDVLRLAEERGLKDAYATLPEAYTCNANGKKKRIDFILHSSDFVARPTPIATIDDDTPLPSDTQPSDHVAIDASFERERESARRM